MLDVLAHRVYRHLFFAQVIAMIGTGLTTVALALLVHDFTEGQAGVVLGTALAIKMVAYVGIAPLVVLTPHAYLDARCWLASTCCEQPWFAHCLLLPKCGKSMC